MTPVGVEGLRFALRDKPRFDRHDLSTLEERSHPHLKRRGVPGYFPGRLPFPVKALQVDGSSEFAAEFEQACQQKRVAVVRAPTEITQAQRSKWTLSIAP